MILWYQLLKYLFEKRKEKFIYQITRFEEIMKGPAVVGALVTAVRQSQPDTKFLEQVADNFKSEWFLRAKMMNQMNLTAHAFLLKYGLKREAALLMAYLGPNIDNSMEVTEFESIFRKPIDDFQDYIEKNSHLLTQSFETNKSLLHHFVETSHFSEEKFRFLVQNGIDTEMEDSRGNNFLNHMLRHWHFSKTMAESIFTVIKLEAEYDEIRALVARTAKLLKNLSEAIKSAKEKQDLTVITPLKEAFRYLVSSPVYNMETLFFKVDEKAYLNGFHIAQGDSDLLDIVANAAAEYLKEEDDKIANFLLLLKSYFLSLYDVGGLSMWTVTIGSRKRTLFLFKKMFEIFQSTEDCLSKWTDGFGMNLLMRIITFTEDMGNGTLKSTFDHLLQYIIEDEMFDDDYINQRVQFNLQVQFKMSHIYGKVKSSKQKNDVIATEQLMKFKKILRKNPETGELEEVVGSKQNPGQVKMVAKEKVLIQDEDGNMVYKRPMITMNTLKNSSTEPVDMDNDEEDEDEDDNYDQVIDEDDVLMEDAISVDGDLSADDDGEEDDNLGTNCSDFFEKCQDWNVTEVKNIQKKILKWTIDQPEIQKRLVNPEHFDNASVISKSNETFKTKKNEYKYAPSASTKFSDTIDMGEAPSKYCCKGTNLLLLASKTKKWNIVKAILSLNPETYSTLFTKGDKKHPLLHKDEQGEDCFYLAIQAKNIEIIKLIVDKIDSKSLKSETLVENKTTFKLLSAMIESGNTCLEEILSLLVQKTGLKSSTQKKKKTVMQSNQKIKIIGSSLGFSFENIGMSSWKCIDCQLQINVDEDFLIQDNNHYFR